MITPNRAKFNSTQSTAETREQHSQVANNMVCRLYSAVTWSLSSVVVGIALVDSLESGMGTESSVMDVAVVVYHLYTVVVVSFGMGWT